MPLDPEDKIRIGIIAQEIEKIAPYCTFKYKSKLDIDDNEEQDIYGYVHDPLIYVLINAVKELDKENKELNKKIKNIERELFVFKNALKQLKI